MFTLLRRIIYNGCRSFRRQVVFSGSAIFVMALTIILATSLFLFQEVSRFLISTIQEKVDISVYFNEESLEEEILKVKDELSKISGVKDIEYVSRDDALSRFTERHKNQPDLMESLTMVGKNPFLASLNVRAGEFAQYADISNFLTNDSFKDIVTEVDYFQREPVIEKLFSLTSDINKAGIIFSIALGFLALCLAFNQVRLAIYDSRKEIKIMRLVGASNWYIRSSFLVQGIIIGALSALIGLLVFVPACLFLSPKLEILAPGLNIFDYFLNNFFVIFSIQLAVGLGMGMFSSLIAVRKYLKI